MRRDNAQLVHFEEVGSKQRCLAPARPGADLKHSAAGVGIVDRNEALQHLHVFDTELLARLAVEDKRGL